MEHAYFSEKKTYGKKRVVFHCTNKHNGRIGNPCKHVWVCEFDLDAFSNPNLSENNRLIFYILKFRKCPACSHPISKSDVIMGHESGTPCNHRCTDSKGHDCDCSCGGKNHGKTWQVN